MFEPAKFKKGDKVQLNSTGEEDKVKCVDLVGSLYLYELEKSRGWYYEQELTKKGKA